MLLAKVHHAAGRLFATLLRRRGIDEINPAQGRILFVLWQEEPLAMMELARRTSLGKSTLSAMVDRLERQGLLERVPGPDRRSVMVRRTRRDEDFRRAFLAVSQEMTELWYAGFTEAERDRFEADLARILANVMAAEGRLEGPADDSSSV